MVEAPNITSWNWIHVISKEYVAWLLCRNVVGCVTDNGFKKAQTTEKSESRV